MSKRTVVVEIDDNLMAVLDRLSGQYRNSTARRGQFAMTRWEAERLLELRDEIRSVTHL